MEPVLADRVATPPAHQLVLATRPASERRRMNVQGARGRHETTPASRAEQAGDEVDVLEVREEPVVESADVVERAAVECRGAAGRAEWVGSAVEHGGELAVQV